MMNETVNTGSSTFLIVLIIALTLVLVFIILPGLFNTIKSLWYWKKNSGPSGFKHESMFYNAKKGRLEDDNMPIH